MEEKKGLSNLIQVDNQPSFIRGPALEGLSKDEAILDLKKDHDKLKQLINDLGKVD